MMRLEEREDAASSYAKQKQWYAENSKANDSLITQNDHETTYRSLVQPPPFPSLFRMPDELLSRSLGIM